MAPGGMGKRKEGEGKMAGERGGKGSGSTSPLSFIFSSSL